MQDARDVVEDLHHGLRDRSITGAADALAHVLERAEEAGVPEEERRRMAIRSFGQLIELATPSEPRRRRWSRRRRAPEPRASEPRAPELQPPARPKQLPPGG